MKKIYSFIVLCVMYALPSFAQNDIDVSHYMFDEISYNPAFTGEGETFRASLLGRKQWLGFNGSPIFETFSIDGATKKFGGFGLHVVNDKLGFENVVTATANYSYGVNLGENSRLTAGFAAGIIDRFVDVSELVYQNQVQVDPEAYEEDNVVIPTINLGLRLQVHDFTLGASATHIASNLKDASIEKLPRHIYGYAKYNIRIRENFSIVPSFLVKYGSAKTQFEGNANFYFNNKFWAGASYRIGESIVAMGGIILKRRIYIGYSYDWNVGSHGRYSYGSHEIFMSWRMKKDPKQQGFYQSTRLFN